MNILPSFTYPHIQLYVWHTYIHTLYVKLHVKKIYNTKSISISEQMLIHVQMTQKIVVHITCELYLKYS